MGPKMKPKPNIQSEVKTTKFIKKMNNKINVYKIRNKIL